MSQPICQLPVPQLFRMNVKDCVWLILLCLFLAAGAQSRADEEPEPWTVTPGMHAWIPVVDKDFGENPLFLLETDLEKKLEVIALHLNAAHPCFKGMAEVPAIRVPGDEIGKIKIVSIKEIKVQANGKTGRYYGIEMRLRISKDTPLGAECYRRLKLPEDKEHYANSYHMRSRIIWEP